MMRSLLFIFVVVLRLGLLPTYETHISLRDQLLVKRARTMSLPIKLKSQTREVINRLRSSVYFFNSVERRLFNTS